MSIDIYFFFLSRPAAAAGAFFHEDRKSRVERTTMGGQSSRETHKYQYRVRIWQHRDQTKGTWQKTIALVCRLRTTTGRVHYNVAIFDRNVDSLFPNPWQFLAEDVPQMIVDLLDNGLQEYTEAEVSRYSLNYGLQEYERTRNH